MTTPLTDDVLQHTVDVWREHAMVGVHTAAALGITRSALENRLQRATQRGLIMLTPVPGTGFEITKHSIQYGQDGMIKSESYQQKPAPLAQFEVPPKHLIKGVSALLDGDGRLIQ